MSHVPLRFALFGLGDFGPQLAKYLSEVGELVAVSDPDSDACERFCSQSSIKVRTYSHHDPLLSSEAIDAVAITSPNFTHREIAVASARAGKHVYCEKAMANNVSECWEMIHACRDAGVKLMVGHKRRLRPPWARMIQLRDQLGNPRAITACAYHDARPYNHQGWWTREAQCGGILPVIGVHIVDWMCAMCGEVDTVRALSAPQKDPRYDFPDTLHVTLSFRSGAIATLTVSLVFPLWKFREAGGPLVITENGAMRFEPYMDHLDLYWQSSEDSQPTLERFDDLGFDHAYRQELGDFVRWVQDGAQPCLTWQEGLRCVEVMEAAHRSAREGGTIQQLPLYPEWEEQNTS